MPRPNPLRTSQSEDNLARRIAYERERMGSTYDGLAARLTRAGCAIQSSAIYKIEKATPRRRITVDELVAFAEVFGVSVGDLLLPPEAVKDRAVAEVLDRLTAARLAYERARAEMESVTEQVTRELAALGIVLGDVTSGPGWIIADVAGRPADPDGDGRG